MMIDVTDVLWAEEGMIAYVPWHEDLLTGKTSLLRCSVATAAGDAARVVNELHGLDRWVKLTDLRVEKGDLHGRS